MTPDPRTPEEIADFRNSEYFQTLEKQATVYLYRLCLMAREGDRASLGELYSIALNVPEMLRYANQVAGGDFAENQSCWPVQVPYFKDDQARWVERLVPANLGKALPVDGSSPTGKGAGMNLSIASKSGFALVTLSKLRELADPESVQSQTMEDLARKCLGLTQEDPQKLAACKRAASLLPPFSKDTLPQWVEAGMLYHDFRIDGDWNGDQWPEKLLERAASKTSRFAKSGRGVKSVVREWLTDGFCSLTKRGA